VLEVDVLLMKGMWRLEIGLIYDCGSRFQLKWDCSRRRLGTGRVGGSRGSRCSYVVSCVCLVLVQTPLETEFLRLLVPQLRKESGRRRARRVVDGVEWAGRWLRSWKDWSGLEPTCGGGVGNRRVLGEVGAEGGNC
jgi:hypothetical protein